MQPNESQRGLAAGRSVGFVSAHLHGYGGLERFELIIARGLASRGWRVTVSTEAGGDLEAEWRSFADIHVRGEGAPVRLAADTDVIYTHWPHLMGTAADAGRNVGKPAVAHLHLPPSYHQPGLKSFVRRHLRSSVDPSVASDARSIVEFAAVSSFTRREWTRAGLPAARVRVVHNGIDTSSYVPPSIEQRRGVREELGIGDDQILIGYVGRIDPLKGIDRLLKGYARLAERDDRLRLVVAGEATKASGAPGQRFAAELSESAPASTIWLGPRSDVQRLYHAMDMFVMPSRWDEPFGLVLIEAMASGVPAIATRRGGVPEILTGEFSKWMVQPTARDLARGLARLIDDDRVGWARRERAMVVERFDLKQTIDGVEQMLDDSTRAW